VPATEVPRHPPGGPGVIHRYGSGIARRRRASPDWPP
jgi:hypothetical protein